MNEDKSIDDKDITNSLINYKNSQRAITADKIYAEIQISKNSRRIFVK